MDKVKYRIDSFISGESVIFVELLPSLTDEEKKLYDQECVLISKWRAILGPNNFEIEILEIKGD